jgi:hypothetical protein
VVGWFSSDNVDHPLFDPKDSRRIIGELQQDVLKGMGEIAYWLDSINSTEGFRLDRRLELIDELEQAARPRLRKLAQDYLQVRQQKFQESRLWTAQADHWRLTAVGYLQCIEGFQADAPSASAIKSRLPVIVGRALRAIGQQLKWLLLRYGPIDGALWGHVGSLYAFAEVKGFADQSVALYGGPNGQSSARTELLTVLMLSAGSTDTLMPEQIDIAERSVAWFASKFLLEAAPEAGCTHVFDLAMRKPPARPHGASMDASVRYFGAGPAFDEINRVLGILLSEGALPSEINLGGTFDPKLVAEVLLHLMQYWALKPPERSSVRHAANVRLTVVQGFANLICSLEPGMARSLDYGPEGIGADSESWVAENASDGGYGAVVPGTRSDWVRIGSLLGINRDGDKYWSVGVIRRLLRDEELSRHVGIELLTRSAILVRLFPTGTISAANATRDNDPGVLLTRQPDPERQIRLLLRAGGYTQEQQLELHVRGQVYRLAPSRMIERGVEFDLAQFTVLQRNG